MQGQTTLAERFAPGPSTAYGCNLELVTQFDGEGAGADVETFETCAYYTTAANPKLQKPGVAVIDLSNPKRPRATAHLSSNTMVFAHESMEIHPARRLLIGSKAPAMLEVYDLSNCKQPVLKASVSLPPPFAGMYSHVGQFSADGMTFYGAKWPRGREAEAAPPPASAVFAVDLSNPSQPRAIALWTPDDKSWITHTVSVNREQTRAYVGIQRLEDDEANSPRPNGLVILDITDVALRKPDPQMHLLSALFWDDAHLSSISTPATIGGHPYLIYSDAAGAVGLQNPPAATACNSKRPSHGFTRIIDIGDDTQPRTVSKLILEVAAPENCSRVVHDPTIPGGYGAFGCSVDDPDDAKLLACGHHEAGVRVFDVRDPAHPTEVAYYKPRARRAESRPGSLWRIGAAKQDLTADSVIVVPLFRNNAREIWFTSTDNGFQVVRFSDRFVATHRALFSP